MIEIICIQTTLRNFRQEVSFYFFQSAPEKSALYKLYRRLPLQTIRLDFHADSEREWQNEWKRIEFYFNLLLFCFHSVSVFCFMLWSKLCILYSYLSQIFVKGLVIFCCFCNNSKIQIIKNWTNMHRWTILNKEHTFLNSTHRFYELNTVPTQIHWNILPIENTP